MTTEEKKNRTKEHYKHLDGVQLLDRDGYFLAGITSVYLQSGRYSTPCRIYGEYAEIYINGDTRCIYAESDLTYRAEWKVGTLDKDGYFHYAPEF